MRKGTALLAAALLLGIAFGVAAPARLAAQGTPAPAGDRARGLVFEGLHRGMAGGPCGGLYQLEVAGGAALCSHGPDPAPPGVDVRTPPPLAALAAGAAATAEADETSGIACLGDGTGGNRIQAIYAVAADRTDRYDAVALLIAEWAARIEEIFAVSAAQVGGERHVRFVSDAPCSLVVDRVILSPGGDDNISKTINELKALGYNSPDRKYLVWTDATVYCGIAQIYGDDRPGPENFNNGAAPMYGRIDAGCWGYSNSIPAHELVHTLGGVQPSAPHATPGYHCTDESDRLCYDDGTGGPLSYDCASSNEAYLDCGHDDYYHPSPPAGSYLATHWNVAGSSFLEAGSEAPVNQAPLVDAGPDLAVVLPDPAALAGAVSDDGMPVGELIIEWRVLSGPGAVTFADPAAPATTATFAESGTYVLELFASDTELSSADSVTVSVTDAAAPSSTTDTFQSSLNKRNPSRSFTVETGGTAEAVLTFEANGGGGKGKPNKKGNSAAAAPADLLLTVYGPDGAVVASAAGGSPLSLPHDTTAGTYTYVVSGAGKVSFVLSVTHAAP